MQYWNYGAALQPCNCPMCSRKITDLTPEASLYSQQDAEVIEVLKKVRKYNRLFVGGTYGLMLVRWTRMLLYHVLRLHGWNYPYISKCRLDYLSGCYLSMLRDLQIWIGIYLCIVLLYFQTEYIFAESITFKFKIMCLKRKGH